MVEITTITVRSSIPNMGVGVTQRDYVWGLGPRSLGNFPLSSSRRRFLDQTRGPHLCLSSRADEERDVPVVVRDWVRTTTVHTVGVGPCSGLEVFFQVP